MRWISTAVVLILLMASTYSQARVVYEKNNIPARQMSMRPLADAEPPNWQFELHKINNLHLAVTNGGTFGLGFANSYIDPETGEGAPSCEYPAGSDITYLYRAAIWAGAVIGRDTLVSVGVDDEYSINEFWPDTGEEGAFILRSNMKTSLDYSEDGVSEQDFICTFTDTFTDIALTGESSIDNRPHIPLGIEIKQRSYAWSYDYAEDFIIFDYTIKNINIYPIQQLYIGIYADADSYHLSRQGGGEGYQDDICGYLHSVPSTDPPGFEDTVQIAWNTDNDGDPVEEAGYEFDFRSPTSLTGTSVLRSPIADLQFSFNWWITNSNPALDWGPRKAGTEERPFRDFGTGLGTPLGDKIRYYVMSSREFDYDQLEAAVNHSSEGWLNPPRNADNFADGFDNRYLFSFGPFDLLPGDTLPITLAYLAGENFHQKGTNFRDYWDPYDPQRYINKLDFSDLGTNARWASWIFDNPGVDTDGDGDSGSVRWVIDSLTMDSTPHFYTGDGVPDFRGAAPPPSPVLDVTSKFGKIIIRWNGEISENNIDVFSRLKDFEGYRVYYGENTRQSDYIQVASYDRENYNIFTWDALLLRWNLSETPVVMDSLRTLFGSNFEPLLYDNSSNAFESGGGYYYFNKQDWNVSGLSDRRFIYKIYPHANPNDKSDTTESGGQRYYEYEYIIDNIEPSRPYYVSVTAFDFGSRKIALSSLESAKNLNAVRVYPLPSTEVVKDEGLSVKVYPNPYRIDGGYAKAGYENRDRTKSAERARAVHFYNLPEICKIRIYTVSGDLVKEIDHYFPGGGPMAQQEEWNLISRNTQAVVTGIYLYHVSSEMGEQIGKLVIIK
ncbi:MAG: hypothetical protein KAR42_13255 [candidate division Zixibacteria bacterium]|nr:hypothetical protein [candidate division Zixibacteria bacterium]